jgi:hypothetical protein
MRGKMNWLGVLTVVNAAIGAAYYLRIIATMFLRPEPEAVPRFEFTPPGTAPASAATGAASAGPVRAYDAPGTPAAPSAGKPATAAVRTYDRPVTADRGRLSPVAISIGLSVALTLLFGSVFPAANALSDRSTNATRFDRTAAVRRTATASPPPPTNPAPDESPRLSRTTP